MALRNIPPQTIVFDNVRLVMALAAFKQWIGSDRFRVNISQTNMSQQVMDKILHQRWGKHLVSEKALGLVCISTTIALYMSVTLCDRRLSASPLGFFFRVRWWNFQTLFLEKLWIEACPKMMLGLKLDLFAIYLCKIVTTPDNIFTATKLLNHATPSHIPGAILRLWRLGG